MSLSPNPVWIIKVASNLIQFTNDLLIRKSRRALALYPYQVGSFLRLLKDASASDSETVLISRPVRYAIIDLKAMHP